MLGIQRSVVLIFDDTSLPLYHSYSVSNWSLNIFHHYQFHLFLFFEACRPSARLWGCRKSSCGHMLCRESRSHFKPRCLLFLPVILKWKTAIWLYIIYIYMIIYILYIIYIWKVANYYWRHPFFTSIYDFYDYARRGTWMIPWVYLSNQ